MSLLCAISGLPPEDPVFSPTGYIFERKLIEKHLQVIGNCPITEKPLTKEELKKVETTTLTKPRPATATSIPGILNCLHEEWESIMLEVFNLRKQLDATRQQLTHALYQYDAATRVIARLMREAREHQNAVDIAERNLSLSVGSEQEGDIGLTVEQAEYITNTGRDLLAKRKARDISQTAIPENIAEYKCKHTIATHSLSRPGIRRVLVHPQQNDRDNAILISGGIDGEVVTYDVAKEEVLSRIKGEQGPISELAISPNGTNIVRGYENGAIECFKLNPDGMGHNKVYSAMGNGSINSIAIHPTLKFLLHSSKNEWAMHDLEACKVVKTFNELPSPNNVMRLHPDGLIAGLGSSDGDVYVWEISTLQARAKLSGQWGELLDLDFSENGFHMASIFQDNQLVLWDLRKSSAFYTVDLENDFDPKRVKFDNSGKYVAVTGKHTEIYHFDSKTTVKKVLSCADHSATVTDVSFGKDLAFFVTGSMDRTVNLYST